MTKLQDLDAHFADTLVMENHLAKSTISAEQASEIQPPSLDCAPNTIEEQHLEYMGWEGELLKSYMELPRNNF